MNAVKFIETVLGVRLSPYQKELVILIDSHPRGYLSEAVSKNPNHHVKQVAQLYNKYEQRGMVGV